MMTSSLLLLLLLLLYAVCFGIDSVVGWRSKKMAAENKMENGWSQSGAPVVFTIAVYLQRVMDGARLGSPLHDDTETEFLLTSNT